MEGFLPGRTIILGRCGTTLIKQVGLVAKFVGDDLVCVVVGNGIEVCRFIGYRTNLSGKKSMSVRRRSKEIA
jgi:hypothetical protein